MGRTDKGRLLLLVYTVRSHKIRIISARGKMPIPEFTNEAEEALFWQSHDSTDHVDWSQAKSVTFANERDVPYQSLIKMILADHIAHS